MAAHIHVLIDKKQQFLALSTLSIVTKILIQQDNRTPNNSVAKETKYYVILPVSILHYSCNHDQFYLSTNGLSTRGLWNEVGGELEDPLPAWEMKYSKPSLPE